MKLRNIFLGLMTLDLLMVPFAITTTAQVVDSVKFEVPPRAISAKFPAETGKTRMFVSSNAPFHIVSKDIIGNIHVEISVSGEYGNQTYGANAQAPGSLSNCAQTNTPDEQIIYSAERKTAENRGGAVSQAVLVEITYDETLDPQFAVVTSDVAETIGKAIPCQVKSV